MRTLYIDVFLLINFSVDLLAIYGSVRLLHITTGVVRLVLASTVAAAYAAIAVLYLSGPWTVIGDLLILCLLVQIVAGRVSRMRRVRFLAVFLLLELLLAGCVYYGYQLLGTWADAIILGGKGGAENRRLLIFAVLVLLSIGLLRLFRTLLGEARAERICRISITLDGVRITTDALVDSGNLLRDPISGMCVILLKPSLARELRLPLMDADTLHGIGADMRVRVRLIPCTLGGKRTILCALRPDQILLLRADAREEIGALIALDKEDGTYGGYQALIPSAVCDHADT